MKHSISYIYYTLIIFATISLLVGCQSRTEVVHQNNQPDNKIEKAAEPLVETSSTAVLAEETGQGTSSLIKFKEPKNKGALVKSQELLNTSDWKTYRDKEYRFKIKLPQKWIYNSHPYGQNNNRVGNTNFILGMGPYFAGDWLMIIGITSGSINSVINNNNYHSKKEDWQIDKRERVFLANKLPVEKVTWCFDNFCNNSIFIQHPNQDLTLEVNFSPKEEYFTFMTSYIINHP